MKFKLSRQFWRWSFGVLIFIASALGGCAHVGTRGGLENPWHETGLASWYGGKFQGRKTASGERFDRHQMTAAHRTLPLGSQVRVHSHSTGKSVLVRINDRGPQDTNRVIDLSQAAAQALGMLSSGTAEVDIDSVN